MERQYIAIDLKSFYASVECVERNLDPLGVNLVVADASRTEKTICLAVSPSLKAYGIPGRARLFEVVQKVREVNAMRKMHAPNRTFTGESFVDEELKAHPELALSYIVAVPRMAYYMEYSSRIYDIYLKYVAPEDMHVYSVDEVFIDATAYLQTYKMTAKEFAMTMIRDVFDTTGITATAGIGTNMYLAKIAMDIVAKHMPADENGVRIAELDEMSYRRQLWEHRPLTDFWRIGPGIARKLEQNGMFTLGDVARCSLGGGGDYHNEEFLYKLFGKNAELIIDHAWGYEPVTIAEIKAYRPESSSVSSGQVLTEPYPFDKARLVTREMADLLALDLVRKGLVSDQLTLTIGYDKENLEKPEILASYTGEVKADRYGRLIPKHAHGTANLKKYTASSTVFLEAFTELFERIVDPRLTVRRITLAACRVLPEKKAEEQNAFEQMDIFSFAAAQEKSDREAAAEEKEKHLQEALLAIKDKYGKNAVLRGMNLEEGATAAARNAQIGGHKA